MNSRHLRAEDLRGQRWRGLVRESTEQQAEKWSPERQRSDLQRAADELGLIPVAPLFYERVGSGEAEHVDELAQALADAKRGQYDVLLVFHTSRFARNVEESRRVKREARQIGLVIYFVAQRIISGSRQARLLEGISEVIDEEANEERRHWIAGGIREKQLAGRWHGAVPVGYRRHMVDREDGSRGPDGRLEADPAHAPIVRRIFDEALAGRTARTISRSLNAEGVRAAGHLWTARYIGQILENPAYKGTLIRYRQAAPDLYYPPADPFDGRREILGDWPAIVDAETFDAVRESVTARIPERGAGRRHPYPLTGILRCRCGRSMTGAHRGPTRYYRCSGRVELLCSAPYVRAEVAEGAVASWLSGYRVPRDWRPAFRAMTGKAARVDTQARRERLTGQLARLRSMYQYGDIPEAEYRAEVDAVKAELAETVAPAGESIEAVGAALEEIGAKWARATTERQRAVVTAILTRAVYRGDDFEWVVRPELRPLLEWLEAGRQQRVSGDGRLYSQEPRYTLRFSA